MSACQEKRPKLKIGVKWDGGGLCNSVLWLKVVVEHRVKGHLLEFQPHGEHAWIYCRSCDDVVMSGSVLLVSECLDGVMAVQRYGALPCLGSADNKQVSRKGPSPQREALTDVHKEIYARPSVWHGTNLE